MQIVTINPSMAAIVNIKDIGKAEIVPIYFTANENWVGTYGFKLFNSDKKNDETSITGTPLEVLNALMTLTIDATIWNAKAGSYYYEISKIEDRRVIFKGSLNIIE